LQEILNLIETIADSSGNVIVSGESGTGKELLAKSIHLNSSRGHHPYVPVNCAGLSEEMLDVEMFGRESSADNHRVGRFELAHKGTLFLDDVDALSMNLQVKLLRTLENGAFERVDGETQVEADVRVIAATTENLREKFQSGTFLGDLFYRLNVVPIFLPPLRERAEDIPLLINHFLELLSPKEPIGIAPQAVELLMGYPWPGNVRELENVVERLVAVSGGREITADDIPIDLKLENHIHLDDSLGEISFHEIIRSTECELIAWAMKKSNGNKTQAAKLLKMKPSTFRDALTKNIDQIEWGSD
jgi:DNA-binding NtrC family response regulator